MIISSKYCYRSYYYNYSAIWYPSIVLLIQVIIIIIVCIQCSILQTIVVEASSASYGKETIIGIVGHDFVMIASDTSIQTNDGSIAFIKSSNVDKIHLLYNPFPYQNRKILFDK